MRLLDLGGLLSKVPRMISCAHNTHTKTNQGGGKTREIHRKTLGWQAYLTLCAVCIFVATCGFVFHLLLLCTLCTKCYTHKHKLPQSSYAAFSLFKMAADVGSSRPSSEVDQENSQSCSARLLIRSVKTLLLFFTVAKLHFWTLNYIKCPNEGNFIVIAHWWHKLQSNCTNVSICSKHIFVLNFFFCCYHASFFFFFVIFYT